MVFGLRLPAVAALGAPAVLNAGTTSILFVVTIRLSLFLGWGYVYDRQQRRVCSQAVRLRGFVTVNCLLRLYNCVLGNVSLTQSGAAC